MSDNTRETAVIELPVSKQKIRILTYLTGKEKLDWIDRDQGGMPESEAIHWMVANLVADDFPKERLAGLHGKDFDFLILELRKVVNASNWKDKKKDSLDNTENL